jgi:hypothetical protein
VGVAFDEAVLGTVFGVANALAAIGVQQMEVGSRAAADGRVGFDWDAHQTEVEQAGL